MSIKTVDYAKLPWGLFTGDFGNPPIYIGSNSAGCHQRLVTKTGQKCFNGKNQQFAQQQSSNENLNKNHKLLIIDIPMLDAISSTDDREVKMIVKKKEVRANHYYYFFCVR